MTNPAVFFPDDQYNRQLLDNVHPSNWQNPTPSGRYNLVVIGAGTAGLVTAAGAAGTGSEGCFDRTSFHGRRLFELRVCAVKSHHPSGSGGEAYSAAAGLGVSSPSAVSVNFPFVMERMRRLRARISPNDSADRFKNLGVDVFFGDAEFVDSETVKVNGTPLKFQHAVIATGARAAAPPMEGLSSVDYLTNETLYSLTQLPKSLGVIGAGPIGCEMAQAFAQLGSQVTLFESNERILPREDRAASEILRKSMEADGVRIVSGGKDLRLRNDNGIRLTSSGMLAGTDVAVDKLLVAVGRKPNIDSLNLEAVGVKCHVKGVVVNDRLQTTNPRIFAAGDVCSAFQFTHAADFMARIVIQNALFHGRARYSSLVIPWCTYTTPEIAHVGLTKARADEENVAIDTFIQDFSEVDRAILDGEESGFVKVYVRKGTDRILGATIVAANAGDMISEITLAMTHGIGLKKFASTIHPYPTQSDAIRRLGDQFNRTRLTPLVKRLLRQWLKWTR